MIAALSAEARFGFCDFVFIDLGSGKGRALLMVPIILFGASWAWNLPALNYAAQENLSKYRSESQKCFAIESICADATEFTFR